MLRGIPIGLLISQIALMVRRVIVDTYSCPHLKRKNGISSQRRWPEIEKQLYHDGCQVLQRFDLILKCLRAQVQTYG